MKNKTKTMTIRIMGDNVACSIFEDIGVQDMLEVVVRKFFTSRTEIEMTPTELKSMKAATITVGR